MQTEQYTLEVHSDTISSIASGQIDLGQIDVMPIDGDATNYAASGFDDQLDRQLGFWANSVIVDNFTSQYVEIVASNRFVQPYAQGVVIPFEQSSQKIRARFGTPAGFSTPTKNNGERAYLTVSAQQLTPAGQGVVHP